MATNEDGTGVSDAIDRRGFLGSMAAAGVPLAVAGARPPRLAPRRASVDFPHHDPARVQEMVGVSHRDVDRVRALLTEQPALAKASWDWGFGDWESALGAASHTGRREIAELLIGHGARPTIFSAAMLGHVDTVRAFLTADPGLDRLHGPHGISLMRHATAGGAEAERVVDYLEEHFGPDEQPVGVPGDHAVGDRYGGRYRIESDPPFDLGVGVRNGWLLVGSGEPTSRVLRVADDVFHPTGAPAVRIRFDVVDGQARSVTIEDGPIVVRGARVEA